MEEIDFDKGFFKKLLDSFSKFYKQYYLKSIFK